MKLFFIFLFYFPGLLFCQNPDFTKLKAGDVLLLPLRCQLCSAISDESNSPYSHSAVAFKWEEKWVVVEALGSVRSVSLNEFIKRSSGAAPIKILRLKSLAKLMKDDPDFERELNSKGQKKFAEKFLGLTFDHQFLWDNTDSGGAETYYCSEFVAKFLNTFSEVHPKISPLPMSFKKDWDFWQNFFEGHIPEGELGLSPGDLERSDQFLSVQ